MLKFLLGLVITIIGIPLVSILLLLDFSPDIPVDAYEIASIEEIFQEEINAAIAGIEGGELALSISEGNLNKIIYNSIKDIYPLYRPTGAEQSNPIYTDKECVDDDCNFIQFSEVSIGNDMAVFGVTGIWVEFYEDVISLNISVQGNYKIDFSTRLRLEFEIEDNEDEYKISYHRIKVGNIPLPKFVVKPIVNAVLNNTSLSADGMGNELFNVDIENLSASVSKTALVEQMATEPSAQAGLNLIFDNQLIQIDVFEDPARLEVYVDINKLSVDTAPMELSSEEFNMEDEITRQMNNIILSVFTGDPQIVVSEELLNRLVSGTMGDMDVSQIIPMGDIDLDISIEGIWVELNEGEFEFNFQMRINNNHLLLELNMLAEDRLGDLVFVINEAYLGRDPGEAASEYITITATDIAEMAGDLSISNDLFALDLAAGEIVISRASISELISASSDGIAIDSIGVKDSALVIGISLPQQELIQEIVSEVAEILDTLEGGLDFIDDSNPDEVAFEEKVSDIAAGIDFTTGDVEIGEEDLAELTELYNELDEEAQAEFIAVIEESLDPELFTDFINSFGN